MARYVAQVPLRWTDQDSYRHLNHARTVTLLEEARIGLFFDAAAGEGITGFADGLLVAGLEVDYRRQIPYRSSTLRVSMWVHEVRAASFSISYEMHDGPGADDAVAVGARTRMALFDLDAQRPRRLSPPEREFLERWADGA
ncbi:acyl-CoA thioesterase [Pseudonocardia bannensis]|uniref:Acyl-CoA thioesterase n=1 Tax=Pseudonocardia bannensis TaxID=630973 RepID=A0A848DGK6_9PSEU|nr:thioesterase family protein [Pseudonocardia bannensis]NMH91798.1 acyl-CoA thioesterase [Pseudonocardia bannensis]